MRAGVLLYCVCNVLNAAVVASLLEITIKGDICARSEDVYEGVPWVNAQIKELTVLHFPADASLGRCNIMLKYFYSPNLTLYTSHGTPCGFGMITEPENRFKTIDMCSANDEARVYYAVFTIVFALNDIKTNPEFSVFITPTWMCDRGDTNALTTTMTEPSISSHLNSHLSHVRDGGKVTHTYNKPDTPSRWSTSPFWNGKGDGKNEELKKPSLNVSCCYDQYEKVFSQEEIPSLESVRDAKNFTMLCDGKYCVEEAFMCDGVKLCADGKDEGEVCGINDGASHGRVSAAWVMAATSALVFTP